MNRIKLPEGFTAIAHRGASGLAPENTASAFSLAAELGASDVELDVQLSRDGVVFLCHDDTLDRYGYPGKRLPAMAAAELEALDVGRWFGEEFVGEPLYTLDRLLAEHGTHFVFHVELKSAGSGLPATTANVISRHGLWDQVVVTSFDLSRLETMRAVHPSARIGWLVSGSAIDPLSLHRAEVLGLDQICPHASSLTVESVAEWHRLFPAVRAWGVPRDRACAAVEVVRLAELGIWGATVNWPDLFEPAA